MPIHDWTRVDAGVFHGFHLSWIAQIKQWMNTGGLPEGFYADAEQYAETKQADVLTLHASNAEGFPPLPALDELEGGNTVVLLETKLGERTARKRTKLKPRQRRLIVRHVTGHRVIAVLEIVSPGNKDRRASAVEFAAKLRASIEAGVHVAMIDLFPPTPAAPHGLHNEIWRAFDPTPVTPPASVPLTLAAFVADRRPRIFFDFRAIGDELPPFPLPLDESRGVMLPLPETYAATFAGSPPYLRDLLSRPA